MPRLRLPLVLLPAAGAVALAAGLLAAHAQQPAPAPQTGTTKNGVVTFKASTQIVLVNLIVTDAKGNVITDLKPSQVTIYEDGKPQRLASFEFERLDTPAAAAPAAEAANAGPAGEVVKAPAATAAKSAAPATPPATLGAANPNVDATTYRDRRLIVLYFDLTTMQPEDLQNVVQQAQSFVKNKMQAADLVGIATLGNTLQVAQDFTSNKTLLMNDLTALNPGVASGFADGDTGSSEGTADNGNSFTADDTEFNLANADRSLEALQSVCDMLSGIQQKKSIMYFTSGIQRSGVDNEITLRSAVNSCVKSDAAIYSVDALGLQALPPGGSVTGGSVRGASAFNGGAQSSTFDAQFAQQETIATLANDTGGRAFLDSNDTAPAYARMHADTESYYVLSYTSTNPGQDGKYRHITVKVNIPGAKITATKGYYAARDINHLNTADRQQQLQDELNANISDHSLDIYLADGYLRLDRNRYYVPVSIIIPGDQIPLHGVNPKSAPQVDIAGEVIDEAGRELDHITQTIKLTGANGDQLQSRNLQYNSGFVLFPGQKYQIRFAAREDQTGQMGAFEAVLDLPNITADEAKNPHTLAISSVLVGSQLDPVRPNTMDPLTRIGKALVMNVNHVFTTGQHMYLYFEVYDPKITSGNDIKLLTNVAFFRGKVKAFESQLLTTEHVTDPGRHAAVVQIDVPLSELKPGYYLCQVNAIDANASKFAFPRIPVLIRPAPAAPAGTGTASLAQ